MPSQPDPTARTYAPTPAAIRAHPRFTDARNAFIDATLGIYENNPFLTRLFLEAGRQIVFSVMLSLVARYDPLNRITSPTVGRLKAMMAQFGVSSPRRIEALVSRLVHSGFFAITTDPVDRRIRIFTPTPLALETSRDWLAAQYVPLDLLYPERDYRLGVMRDSDFHMKFSAVAYDMLGNGASILAGNPGIMLFLSRDAGFMILTKLIQLTGAGEPRGAANMSFKALGGLFGVSGSHIRALLHDAQDAGFAVLSGRGGNSVELTPVAFEIYERFIADSMAGNSMICTLALQRLGNGRPPLGSRSTQK